VTDSSAFINQLALIVVVFSGLQTLFNFNPLIKLDGYYMLSDFLEVPNLRSKALRSLWDWVAANGKSPWSMREKRAQIIYGAAAFVFSMTLLVYVYSRLFTWATTNYQLAGFVMFGIFANFTLRKSLVEPMEGMKAVVSRVSIKRYRNIGIGLAAVILSFVIKIDLKVTADPTKIIPADNFPVTAETEGILLKILVRDGAVVHKGDRLAIMTDFAKQDKIADTIGLLNQQRKNLDDLKKGTRPEEIEEENRVIDRLKIEHDSVFKNDEQKNQLLELRTGRLDVLDQAKQVRDRDQELLKRGLTPPIIAAESESNVRIAESAVRDVEAQLRVLDEKARNSGEQIAAEIREHESKLKRLEAGNRPDQILQVEADIKRLEDMVERYTKELQKTEVTSKFDGLVNTPFVEQLEGKHRDPGEEIMRVVVTTKVQGQLMVPELEYEDVFPGNAVTIRFKSFPNRDFNGKIDRIATEAVTVDGQQMMPMYVNLDNPDGVLKPGMSGIAKISCGDRMLIELMTRRLHRWIKTEFWKLW